MMRREDKWLAILLSVFLLALAGCGGASDTASSVAPSEPTATPTADAGAYWSLVQQAQDAYAKANFSQSLDLARQAVALNPQDNTAWELYRQAAVAAAADAYLTDLPAHRWRLPVDRYLQDVVNQAKDWFLIDIREPDEFTAGHIQGAINIPLRELLHHLDELPNSKTAPILVYCHSQKRSTHAIVILHELGYRKAYHLEGGYAAYEDWMTHNPLPTPGPTPTPAPEEPDFGC